MSTAIEIELADLRPTGQQSEEPNEETCLAQSEPPRYEIESFYIKVIKIGLLCYLYK